MIAGPQPDHRLCCKRKCVVSVRLFSCSPLIRSLPSLKSDIFDVMIPHGAASDGTANEKERTGTRQQPDVPSFYSAHLLQHLHRLLSQDILIHPTFTLLLNTGQARTASWRRSLFVFLLRSHLITQVSVRSFRIMATKSRCVVSCFGWILLFLYFYVSGLPHFKNRLRLDDRPVCRAVWVEPKLSRTQIMVKCQQCLCICSSW